MPTACSGKEQDRQMRTLQRALEEKQNELSDLREWRRTHAHIPSLFVLSLSRLPLLLQPVKFRPISLASFATGTHILSHPPRRTNGLC